MYVAYLLILTAHSGAGEIVDPQLHPTLESCQRELSVMQELVQEQWAVHGIIRMKGECRLQPDNAFLIPRTPYAWRHS